eukprot:866537-Prymnesium_polylepis.3
MSFGEPGDDRPSACKKCKTDTMIDLLHKLCPCGRHMTFGEPGDDRPSACRECKTDTMVDVVSKICENNECHTMSNFPNKAGDSKALCAKHAFEAGTIAAYNPRASKAACAAQDALAREGFASYEHEHINPSTLEWEGEEVEGLVAPRKHRPDGVRRDAAGNVVEVFFYHGNWFHGFPPEHELYDTEITMPKGHKVNSKERYEKTMADMKIFKDRGYRVCYLWEHHHSIALRAKARLGPMCRWL